MDQGTDSPENERAPEAAAAVTPGRRVLFLSLIALAILAAALSSARLAFRDTTPPLTREAFEAAERSWREKGPADYDLEVKVVSRTSGKYRVEVRKNEPMKSFRNDAPLTQMRTFGTWTVPGMFETMASDVEIAFPPPGRSVDSGGKRLTLRAEFSPENGAPLKYRRIEWGSDFETEWEITRFEEIDAAGNRRSLLTHEPSRKESSHGS